jgi:hypothetical protein
VDIKSLLREAFVNDRAENATSAIDRARARVAEVGGIAGRSLEVVVPERPDEGWLRERVLGPLVYFCESTGAAPPSCAGVFMSFFYGGRLYCVLGAEILAWASELGIRWQGLTPGLGELPPPP